MTTPTANERTAIHEAAHAVASLALGITVQEVSIKLTWAKGRCLVIDPYNQHFFRQSQESLLCVTMAGRAAEELHYGQSTNHAQDQADAEAIARTLSQHQQCVDAVIAYQLERAKDLLRWRWKNVEALAAELLKQQTILGHDQVKKAAGMI